MEEEEVKRRLFKLKVQGSILKQLVDIVERQNTVVMLLRQRAPLSLLT